MSQDDKGQKQAREWWIQKGTPDLIGDTFQESECFCDGDRCELPVIHVIEYAAFLEMQKKLDEYKLCLNSINSKVFPGQTDSIDAMVEIVRERDAAMAEVKVWKDRADFNEKLILLLEKEIQLLKNQPTERNQK